MDRHQGAIISRFFTTGLVGFKPGLFLGVEFVTAIQVQVIFWWTWGDRRGGSGAAIYVLKQEVRAFDLDFIHYRRALKAKSCHDAKFFVNSVVEGCPYDNIRYHQL